jgi:hypothetical protein
MSTLSKEPAPIALDFLQVEGIPMNPVVESYGPQDQSITRFTPWNITVHRNLPGVGFSWSSCATSAPCDIGEHGQLG